MYAKDYISKHGKTIKSKEKVQDVPEDSIIMFDNVDKLDGYPANQKAFSKYVITTKPSEENDFIGVGTKKDSTQYMAKQMDESFSCIIWDGSTLPGKKGDYLVAAPPKDYRVIAKEMWDSSYMFS